MPKEPACHLCSGPLAREQDVSVGHSGGSGVFYRFAWVCKSCGASWPIAVKSAGFLKGYKPLWDNGTRADD
jgi:hypothetical protein